MTTYRNKYLEMLKAENSKKPPGVGADKNDRNNFVNFVGSPGRPFSEFLPPLDAEGVPCGGCPTCHRGEFWRWPKYHRDHDPTGWICWFCFPPPEDSGPCDFCGVPEDGK